MPRRYELKRRAEQVEETRERIARAAYELHRDLGPALTTISAIAERAGVQRLTVYRHFPDELSLFTACSTHFMTNYPPPDPALWQRIDQPEARLRAALTAFYAYYRANEGLIGNVTRDAEVMPVLAQINEGWDAAIDWVREDLATAWKVPGKGCERLRASIVLALDFRAWQALARQGVSDELVVELMVGLARVAAGQCAERLAEGPAAS